MDYFKSKTKGFYIAIDKNSLIIVNNSEENSSLRINRIEFLNTWKIIANEKCTKEEFEKAYLEVYSQIHTKFLSSKEQSRDEFIKNMQIKMDEHEF